MFKLVDVPKIYTFIYRFSVFFACYLVKKGVDCPYRVSHNYHHPISTTVSVNYSHV